MGQNTVERKSHSKEKKKKQNNFSGVVGTRGVFLKESGPQNYLNSKSILCTAGENILKSACVTCVMCLSFLIMFLILPA